MEQTVKKGDTVVFHYLGTLDNGHVFDGTKEGQPMQAVIGQHQVLPGIELSLEGMNVGEHKKLKIMPEDGYGKYDKALVVEYPLQNLPQDPKPGAIIEMHKEDGSKMLAKIVEIKGDNAVIDLNHPLADQPLNFEIQVLAINPQFQPHHPG